jgi:hypothetical protein
VSFLPYVAAYFFLYWLRGFQVRKNKYATPHHPAKNIAPLIIWRRSFSSRLDGSSAVAFIALATAAIAAFACPTSEFPWEFASIDHSQRFCLQTTLHAAIRKINPRLIRRIYDLDFYERIANVRSSASRGMDYGLRQTKRMVAQARRRVPIPSGAAAAATDRR